MAESRWRFDDPTHRHLFGQLLAPLIAAAGSLEIRNWRDEAYSRTQLRTWMLTMGDVGEPLLRQAIDRVVQTGVTWMPRPGDVKAVCCDIRDELRAEAARRAKTLSVDCAQCDGSQWVSLLDADGETEIVKRCWCFTRGLELVAEAGEPLKRPALPPALEPEPAV